MTIELLQQQTSPIAKAVVCRATCRVPLSVSKNMNELSQRNLEFLQSVLEETWSSLRPEEQARTSKIQIAARILELAARESAIRFVCVKRRWLKLLRARCLESICNFAHLPRLKILIFAVARGGGWCDTFVGISGLSPRWLASSAVWKYHPTLRFIAQECSGLHAYSPD